jgi:predicted transglutaminase-like cysteine proteinase
MTHILRAAHAAGAGIFLSASLLVFEQAYAATYTPPPHLQSSALEQAAIAPGGFINFEMHYPQEIRDTAPAFATPDQIGTARAIDGIVNGNIVWRETQLWAIAADGPAEGDCKTYALTKRHDLRQRGIPDGALRLAIVSTPLYKELHMVLEVRAVDGVYVLDSLKNNSGETFYKTAAMPASYTVLKYQAWGRPEHWLAPVVLTSQTGAEAQDTSY